MLDSTLCSGEDQTQTLCCPTSSEVPTCQWRGFHNSGKCTGGCNAGEAEIGTVKTGCNKSGYQSACCSITNSTMPWSQCQWTSDCKSDKTCPSGYSNFVVGSRDGWGGKPSCKDNKTYNYCCSGSSVPDAFTNCDWKGFEVKLKASDYCTDACPSGSIRIAAESLNTIFTNGKVTAQVSGCYMGEEAYCCAGANQTANKRSDTSTSQVGVYQDQTARNFDAYLQKFLADPVCPNGWENEYSASFDMVQRRDLMSARSVTDKTSQDITLAFLLPMLQTLVTSAFQRDDLRWIWDYRTAEPQSGLADVATIENMTTFFYGVNDVWTGTTSWDSTSIMAQTLCNIADSTTALQEVQLATDVLCVDPSTGESMSNSGISARTITVAGTADRSANECSPTMSLIFAGIQNVSLSPLSSLQLSMIDPKHS